MEVEMLERVAQRDENAIGVEGLLENVIRPQLRGFDRGLNRRVAADHHYDGTRVVRPDRLQGLDSVDPRHLHVEKDEMRMPTLVFLESVHRRRDSANLIALELEQLAEGTAHTGFIVDDQDATVHWTFL